MLFDFPSRHLLTTKLLSLEPRTHGQVVTGNRHPLPSVEHGNTIHIEGRTTGKVSKTKVLFVAALECMYEDASTLIDETCRTSDLAMDDISR